ncbi:MAG: hypothetical protein CSYNP_03997 [Syntrophus sp. SKADARSKE-3]|nr:hypothetical protein [Syntrophus sp. SKADARSKE-3]
MSIKINSYIFGLNAGVYDMSDKPKISKGKLWVLIMSIFIAGISIPGRIAVTLSPSLDKRVFFVSSPGNIKRGDYVTFTISDRITEFKPTKVSKKIVCVGGDVLTVAGDQYYCNGISIGTAKDRDMKGQKTTRFQWNGRIPDDSLFVTGTHKDSYDSRYFGFIKTTDILAILYPII